MAQSKGNYLHYQVMVGGRSKVVDGYKVDGQLQASAAVVCDLCVNIDFVPLASPLLLQLKGFLHLKTTQNTKSNGHNDGRGPPTNPTTCRCQPHTTDPGSRS